MFRSLLIIKVIIVLLSIFLIQGCSQSKLLTADLSQIKKITITSKSQIAEYTMEKNEDKIIQIYELINSTKTRTEAKPNASNEQTSEPYYIIDINYQNASQDTIYSTETGKFIYKKLSGNGWVGGTNEQLKELLRI